MPSPSPSITRSKEYFDTPSTGTTTSRRPLLHHLNADTTWLLQLPIPESHQSTSGPNKRQWFNIILDPWLTGPQSDVAAWFSRQWHAIEPAFQSVAEVNDLCAKAERSGPTKQVRRKTADDLEEVDETLATSNAKVEDAAKGRSYIDAIAISHEFTDHCHKDTLVQFDKSTPVIAAPKAATLVRGWKHFDTVIETPSFGPSSSTKSSTSGKSGSSSQGGDWATIKCDALPDWLGIGRIINAKDALYYHSAILLAFRLDDQPVQGIIYTPHGIKADSLSSLVHSDPPISTLAILHGLHDVSIDWGQQLNLGGYNGLEAVKALKARYWVGTHDEVKKGGGVVSWFLRRKVYTAQEIIEQAEWENGDVLGGGKYLEIGNGEVVVLA